MEMINKWLCDLFDMEETSFGEDVLKYIQDHPEEKKELQEKLGIDEEQLIKRIKEILSIMKNKLYLLFLAVPLLLMSCEGSRPRRMYDAGKSVYDEYEETGDPTGLILFIVGLLVVGGLWLWNKSKDK